MHGPEHVCVNNDKTMTHSDEVTNKCQKLGLTHISAGVMTPCKKNLLKHVSLALQARKALVTLQKTVHRVMWKKGTNRRMLFQTRLMF